MAAENEVERLVVVLEAEYAKFLADIKEGVDKGEKEFDKFSGTGKKALQEVGKEAKTSALSFGLITGAAIAATTAIIAMATRGVQALAQLGAKALGLHTEFENAEITFTKMLGDKDVALAFLDQLKQKAIELKVPFSDATKFAKSILPDTSSIEQFNELLRLATIGAKDAKLPLDELIFAFNEAVSGDFVSIRDRLDIPKDVIARIKEADDTTAALTEELNKLFTKRGINDINAFSDTLDTATANLTALGEKLLFIASESGFETLKESAQRFLSILQGNEPGLEKISKAVGDIANSVLEFVSSGFLDNLENVDTENVLELADSTLRMVENVQLLAQSLPGVSFDNLVTGADELVDKLNLALITATQLNALSQAGAAKAKAEYEEWVKELERLHGQGTITTEVLKELAGIPGVVQATNELAKLVGDEEAVALAARSAAAGQEAYNAVITEAAEAIQATTDEHERLRQAREADTSASNAQTDATNRINEALARNSQEAAKAAAANAEFADKAGDFGTEMADLQAETQEQLAELEEEHNERMLEIDEQYNEASLELAEKRGEALADLENETADRRREINDQARDDLAQLGRDTDDQIAEERDQFNDQERRQTENHLRDMQGLFDSYLFDLQDAVTRRDARAIVDLRRRFRQESRDRTEDFTTQQRRRREDLDQRVDEIRENERAQRDEILASQQEQLDTLREQEAEKRDQINESYDEQFAALTKNYQKQKDAEIENYTERQEELNKALQKRLEAIAKELADEKDVTEEQAKALLEVLNATYGAGGDIDKMMEDFASRRRQKMTVTVEVEKALGGDDSGSSRRPPRRPAAGSGQGQGAHPGQIPGFQHGGFVPGPTGAPLDAIVHGGELIVPQDHVRQMVKMMQMSANAEMNHRFQVDVNLKGVPAGMDQHALENVVSAVFVKAMGEAGISRKR